MNVIIEFYSELVEEIHLCQYDETAYKIIRQIAEREKIPVLVEDQIQDPKQYYTELYDLIKEETEFTKRNYYWGEHQLHISELPTPESYYSHTVKEKGE